MQDSSGQKRGNQKFSVIRGIAEDIPADFDVSPFSAAEKKAWVYISRCNKGSTVDGLKKYLGHKLPNISTNNYDISIISHDDSKFISFKLGFHFDLQPQIMDSTFWPKNVIIKRFRFFRNTHTSNAKNATPRFE